jgi:hypothetical protein
MADYNPASNYLLAVTEFLEARAALQDFKQRISAAIEALNNPLNVAVTGIKFPIAPEVAQQLGRKEIDGLGWPTSQAIGDALVRYKQAHQKLEQKWKLVPTEIHPALTPPAKLYDHETGQSK